MVIKDYIRLTSPGITVLVLVTGCTGMWIAARGDYQPVLFFWTLFGLGLTTAGASVLNNYYDRDIDLLMVRTQNRPLPAGRIKAREALIFGLGLSIVGLMVLMIWVNTISAVLTGLALVSYSYLYTVHLKRSTPLATELGGISGALPPLIGCAAISGTIGIEAWLLFAIMLLWQPPHFWALALKYKKDYKKAAIPTMPVEVSELKTEIRSLIYVVALVIVATLPYFIGMVGEIYLCTAIISGIIYTVLSVMSIVSKQDLNQLLFRYSIVYITLIFIVMIIDLRQLT